ncbi:MAG: serine/threonine protein kinase [Myxococcota bacterium]
MTVAHDIHIEDGGDGGEPSSHLRASSPPPPPVPSDGIHFGRYVLRHKLASGGMASVHLAVTQGSAGFQKVFALKRMHPHLAQEPGFVAMFLDEARIAARIDHPNVCAVFDFGEVDGEHFMAMEFLMGEPYGKLLARLLRQPPVERDRARALVAHLIADACEGLHAAHELRSPEGEPLQVVHRDISPHNLVVTYAGVLKVVDFGVARAAQQFHQTTTGTVKGKFGYMAPEQMRGGDVDRRADVWSLGVVLWESLAGCSLFRRATQSETVLAVMDGRVPPLAEFDPGIDPELDAIVRRACATAPADRYPTARDLGRALRQWSSSRGGAPDAGEVADHVQRLFPHGVEEKRALVQRVLTESSRDGAPKAPANAAEPISHSTVVGRSGSEAMPDRPRWRVALPLLVAAALGAAGAVVFGSMHRGSDGPEGRAERSVDGVEGVAASPAAPAGADEGIHAEAEAPTEGEGGAETGAGFGTDDETGAPKGSATEDESGAEVEAADGSGHRPETGGKPDEEKETGTETESGAKPDEATRAGRTARAKPGMLNVAARGGWANVYVGRRRLGPTPGSYRLPAGRHVLQLRGADGSVKARVPVRVRPGKVSRITVDLKR